MKRTISSLVVALVFVTQAGALSIGYFGAYQPGPETGRELYGFSGVAPYLGSAKQWLAHPDQGHTLLSTHLADSAFLSGVDAFYVGLVKSVTADEIAALTGFVEQGGFLFIQADYAGSPGPSWTAPAASLLANWGFTHGGSYTNLGAPYDLTATPSSWLPDPALGIATFVGDTHSAIIAAPDGSLALATDQAGRTVLALLEVGTNGGAVLVATDINFWNDLDGWKDARNRSLWASIWGNAAARHDRPNAVSEEGSTAVFAAVAILALAAMERRRRRAAVPA